MIIKLILKFIVLVFFILRKLLCNEKSANYDKILYNLLLNLNIL